MTVWVIESRYDDESEWFPNLIMYSSRRQAREQASRERDLDYKTRVRKYVPEAEKWTRGVA